MLSYIKGEKEWKMFTVSSVAWKTRNKMTSKENMLNYRVKWQKKGK